MFDFKEWLIAFFIFLIVMLFIAALCFTVDKEEKATDVACERIYGTVSIEEYQVLCR